MMGLIRAEKTIKAELDAVSNKITFETTTCAVPRHARRKIGRNFIIN